MLSENILSGYIIQYERVGNSLKEARRWAKIAGPHLDIYADKNKPGFCLKISVHEAQVEYFRNQRRSDPWILITEKSGALYYIRPEKENEIDIWFKALRNTASVKTAFRSVSQRSGSIHDQANRLHKNSVQATETNKLIQVRAQMNHGFDSKRSSSSKYSADSIYEIPNGSRLFQRDHYGIKRPSVDDIPPEIPPKSTAKRGNVKHNSRGLPATGPSLSNYPCRQRKSIETVKESSLICNNPSKRLNYPRSNYSITGLAKRMSISASDLLGKSRDELILMLLQLNREKANLTRWKEYFNQQIATLAPIAADNQQASNEVDAIMEELGDVEGQLQASRPLITFMDNIIRMSDLYAGDDAMFASEYKKHLLNWKEVKPVKRGVAFVRKQQEREVAKAIDRVSEELNQRPPRSSSTSIRGLITSAELFSDSVDGEATPKSRSRRTLLQEFPEQPVFKERRLQLEAELQKLDTIWTDGLYGLNSAHDISQSQTTSRSTIHSRRLPRRSTRTMHRSDVSGTVTRHRTLSTTDLSRCPSHHEVLRRSNSTAALTIPVKTFTSQRSVFKSNPDLSKQMKFSSSRQVSSNSKCSTSTLGIDPTPPSTVSTPLTSGRLRGTSLASSFLSKPAISSRSRWKHTASEHFPASPPPPPPPVPPPPLSLTRGDNNYSLSENDYEEANPPPPELPPRQSAGLSKWKSYGDHLSTIELETAPNRSRHTPMSHFGRSLEASESNISRKAKPLEQRLIGENRIRSNAVSHLQTKLNDLMLDLDEPIHRPENYNCITVSRQYSPSTSRSNSQSSFADEPLNPALLQTAVDYAPLDYD